MSEHVFTFRANLSGFERQIEQELKPAIAKAILAAVGEFVETLKPELVEVESPARPEKTRPWWVTETPWFERHGKLTPEQAADLEEGTYGKGLHLEEWQIQAVKRLYGDKAMTMPVKFIGGKFVR